MSTVQPSTRSFALEHKSLDAPDERHTLPKAKAEVVKLGDGVTISRVTCEPGWRFSEHLGPALGTEVCPRAHIGGVVLSGRQRVRLADGTEREVGPGDVLAIPPGHDAWVVGDEPFVVIEIAADERLAPYLAPVE